jgi:subtilisin family serine protease
MRTGGLLQWLLVLAVVAAPVLPVATVSDPVEPGSPVDTVGKVEGLNVDTAGVDETESVDLEVEAIIEIKRGASIPETVEVQREYTWKGARQIETVVPMSSVRHLSRDPRIRTVRIEHQDAPQPSRVAPGVSIVGADGLHGRGITGEGVTVGVIDRGFRPSDPEIAANVGAYRVFESDGGWAHGTGVASVVVDTAPDAQLHLAAVGSTTTSAEYREAVEWLRDSGADVIVDSGSYFGSQDAERDELARVAADAAEDTVFVTSAGNYAERHWGGSHEATGEGEWVPFGDDSGNDLGDGQVEGAVSVELRWDDPAADYDLYLMRPRQGDDAVVAASRGRQDGNATARESISATLPLGNYYVAVRGHDADGTHDLELFASHTLAESTPNGSLTTPATVEGVIAVGSYGNDTVKPFSSRGPVGNRTGVDLVAPDSVVSTGLDDQEGTSYAAPYVAGTVALLRSEHPHLDPADLRSAIRTSARDVGSEGPDVAAGHGLVDAGSAYRLTVWQYRHDQLNATG